MTSDNQIKQTIDSLLSRGEAITPLDFYNHISFFQNIFNTYQPNHINHLYGSWGLGVTISALMTKKVLSAQNMAVSCGIAISKLNKMLYLVKKFDNIDDVIAVGDKIKTYSFNQIYYSVTKIRKNNKRFRIDVEMKRFADNIMAGIVNPDDVKYKQSKAMYNYIMRNTPRPMALDNKYYLEHTFCSCCFKLNPNLKVRNIIKPYEVQGGMIKIPICKK